MFIPIEPSPLDIKTYGNMSNPVVVLNHSLATDKSTWDLLVPELEKSFYVICFDMRGHGNSATPDEPFSIQNMASDVIDILNHFNITKAHFIGLSLGGMIGQYLAIHHSNRLLSATIASAISRIDEDKKFIWRDRIAQVTKEGLESQVEPTLKRWFTESTFSEKPDIITKVRQLVALTPVEGYLKSCQAISELNLTQDLHKITLPTLVLVGAEDCGTPPAVSQIIHENIAKSEYHIIPEASHQCALEQPDIFNHYVMDFLARHNIS